MPMQQVSKINVVNKGAYVMNFSVQWLDSNGDWTTSDWNSGNYSVGSSRETPELGSIGVPGDAPAVTVYGHAILGPSGRGHGYVQYEPGSQNVATYDADGTTYIGFDIELVG
jgi:hypothetical protein